MRGSRLVLALVVLAGAAVLWLTWSPSGGKAESASGPSVATADVPPAPPAPTAPLPVPAALSPAAPEPAPAANPPTVALAPPPRPAIKTRSGVALPPPPSGDVEALEQDLTRVQFMFREYHDLLGENPVGGNAEIMRAVLGGNRKQAKIAAPENQTLNGDGELCDRWGTPYFFHQVSRDKMEIRSAGPDRKMWTADDQQM